MTETTGSAFLSPLPLETGCDPIEDRLRANVRATIETMFEEERAAFLGRLRYGHGAGDAKGTPPETCAALGAPVVIP